ALRVHARLQGVAAGRYAADGEGPGGGQAHTGAAAVAATAAGDGEVNTPGLYARIRDRAGDVVAQVGVDEVEAAVCVVDGDAQRGRGKVHARSGERRRQDIAAVRDAGEGVVAVAVGDDGLRRRGVDGHRHARRRGRPADVDQAHRSLYRIKDTDGVGVRSHARAAAVLHRRRKAHRPVGGGRAADRERGAAIAGDTQPLPAGQGYRSAVGGHRGAIDCPGVAGDAAGDGDGAAIANVVGGRGQGGRVGRWQAERRVDGEAQRRGGLHLLRRARTRVGGRDDDVAGCARRGGRPADDAAGGCNAQAGRQSGGRPGDRARAAGCGEGGRGIGLSHRRGRQRGRGDGQRGRDGEAQRRGCGQGRRRGGIRHLHAEAVCARRGGRAGEHAGIAQRQARRQG